MRIGCFVMPATLSELRDAADNAATARLQDFWVAQAFGFDALTALTTVLDRLPHAGIGTVVPAYTRHPMALAAQALTLQELSGGRLTLGVGLSHKIIVEGMWGGQFRQPASFLREYLSAVVPLAAKERAHINGTQVTARGKVEVPDADAVPVVAAALAELTLQAAGELATGTITWLAGPDVLAHHVVPTVQKAAAAAGRPEPRIIATLPVSVTDDVPAARAEAGRRFGFFTALPEYRAVLDRGGAGGPQDVAVVGDEDSVRTQLHELAEIGVTTFLGAVFGDERRTFALLGETCCSRP